MEGKGKKRRKAKGKKGAKWRPASAARVPHPATQRPKKRKEREEGKKKEGSRKQRRKKGGSAGLLIYP